MLIDVGKQSPIRRRKPVNSQKAKTAVDPFAGKHYIIV